MTFVHQQANKDAAIIRIEWHYNVQRRQKEEENNDDAMRFESFPRDLTVYRMCNAVNSGEVRESASPVDISLAAANRLLVNCQLAQFNIYFNVIICIRGYVFAFISFTIKVIQMTRRYRAIIPRLPSICT